MQPSVLNNNTDNTTAAAMMSLFAHCEVQSGRLVTEIVKESVFLVSKTAALFL